MVTHTARPGVTVVIPVKDDADKLAVCLRALAGQSLAPDEVVVVDNGSRDGSAAVAASFGARVIDHPGGGIPAASSAGYDAATSEIIARLDADCVPGAGWVAAMTDALAERTDVAAVTGGARFTDGPRWLRSALAACYLGAYFVMFAAPLGHLPLFGSNFAMRRSAWRTVSASVHRDDLLVHDDLDLAYHLGARHRIGYVRNVDMSISIRPLTDPGSMALRVQRGFHTVLLHWPAQFPPLRWLRRWRVRLG